MTQLSSIGQRATNMSNNIMKNDYFKYGLIVFIIIVFLIYVSKIINIRANNNTIIDFLTKQAKNNNAMSFTQLINCNNGNYYSKNIKIGSMDLSYNYRLKDYYIKTAYNACCTGRFKNDYVDLKSLNNCYENGVRALDLEIYSKNKEPIVGSSSGNSYHYKESYNHLPLSDVLSNINNKFVNGTIDKKTYGDYPLFLFFRIRYGGQNNSSNKTIQDENVNNYDEDLKQFYNTVYDTIKDSFGDNFKKARLTSLIFKNKKINSKY